MSMLRVCWVAAAAFTLLVGPVNAQTTFDRPLDEPVLYHADSGWVANRSSQPSIEYTETVLVDGAGHVTLLHSIHRDERWDPGSNGYEELCETGSAEERAPLEAAAERLRADGIEVDVAVTEGSAPIELIHHAIDDAMDAVIIGKRAADQRDGRKLGSVSQGVVRYCPCPVIVVRPGSSAPPKVIVAATDASAVGARVIDAAAAVAQRCESTLHVIHAIQINLETQMSRIEAQEAFVRNRRESVEAEVRAQAEAAGFTGDLKVHAGATAPTRAIQESEKRLHPDLVVMGTVSRAGLIGFVMGNTAERLLGTLDCSLLVVKPEGFRTPLEL